MRWKKECIKVSAAKFVRLQIEGCVNNAVHLLGDPTSSFYKVWRSKYCLEIKPQEFERQKKTTLDNRPIHLRYQCVCVCVCVFFFFFFFSLSKLPDIFGGFVVHILLPRYCDNCLQRYPENFVIKTKRSLKSCNGKYGYSMPCKFRPAPLE